MDRVSCVFGIIRARIRLIDTINQRFEIFESIGNRVLKSVDKEKSGNCNESWIDFEKCIILMNTKFLVDYD